MNIVLTYDPRWEHTPEEHTLFWESLDSVEYVAGLLEKTGNSTMLVKADDTLEFQLKEISKELPVSLVFWLNEFIGSDYGKRMFTVEIIENIGMMHTGPDSDALNIGLDKETTKNVFRRLGLPTPESYVVYPGNYSSISHHAQSKSNVIIKPLLRGGSRGIYESSIVRSDNFDAICERVKRIHSEYGEPAIVEEYIGGEKAKEFSVPILISFDGRIAELPIVEIDLSLLPVTQGRFRCLTHDIKVGKYNLKIPAELPPEIIRSIHSDVGRIIKYIGCKDMTRVDMRSDATGLYYIEVNANPGLSRCKPLTTSAYFQGLGYPEIIAFIPYQAMLRYGLEPPRELEDLVKPVMALFDTTRAVAANF